MEKGSVGGQAPMKMRLDNGYLPSLSLLIVIAMKKKTKMKVIKIIKLPRIKLTKFRKCMHSLSIS
jgi:hypothetical protein